MTTNIYGKIDCFSNIVAGSAATQHHAVNESYVQLYKFMQYLETQGVVSLYTMYSGSVQGAGSFGIGYWDEASRIGSGAFSVWRWLPNTSSNRSWDWYMMLQCTSGAANIDALPAQALPLRTDVNSTEANSTLTVLAAAFALSGSGASISPWNGTVDVSGVAAKGSVVWTSGSGIGNSVHVFPRGNNITGSFATNKQDTFSISRYATTTLATNAKMRTHMFSDGDGILICLDSAISNGGTATLLQNYNVFYIGPYSMIDAISQSNPGKVLGVSGSKGFMAFSSKAENALSTVMTNASTTTPNTTNIGSTTAAAATQNGGAFANTDIGVRIYQIDYGNYNTTTYAPNKLISTGSVFDEKVWNVTFTETSLFNGAAGYLNTPLIRSVVGLQSHDVRPDGLRAVFGGSNTVTNPMITTPWSGSNSPGTNTTRDGINFTIANYTL